MSRKRKPAGNVPFWASSALLTVVATGALGFGLWGGQSVSQANLRPAPVAAVPTPEPLAEAAPVPLAKPEQPSGLSAHHARFLAEQESETARLLAEHPPLSLDQVATSAARVEVIALEGTSAPPPEDAATYDSYRETVLGQRELVALHITRQEPFFLMLLSEGPVTFDVQTQVTGALRGVLISSDGPSTIEGLPKDVPLQIVTGDVELAPFAARPKAEDDSAALENGLRQVFPEQEIGIKRHDDSPVILVR